MHNLIRRLMLQSSRQAGVALSRISFAGALAVARRYGEALWKALQRLDDITEMWVVMTEGRSWQPPTERELNSS